MWRRNKRSELAAGGAEASAQLNLRYCGNQPMDLRGAATGKAYRFSPQQPVQPVDPKDAVFLLACRLFRLAR